MEYVKPELLVVGSTATVVLGVGADDVDGSGFPTLEIPGVGIALGLDD